MPEPRIEVHLTTEPDGATVIVRVGRRKVLHLETSHDTTTGAVVDALAAAIAAVVREEKRRA